ncbi:polysaccharide biosynthesis tyrosine autokinase [Calothrix sp. FACHB-1219]|uniref:GumC family protein n=1 Tax=unclassified Calothrix TaxID=2619626 RepID=UPI00168908EB|nr:MULTISPECIES: polysaccharide biosynthesis tyrosine autokinase [unclassified Calothrix]MBD2201297.1 polysaccharide biosynthesis tyrosine autokinase [Calothrix sp. FACHB-168]MBD2215731.1 polysaccharide biosynthesis tyrosine autokinase [Calothrix sp. FACHB-1219]
MPTQQDDGDLINFQQYWAILKRRWTITAIVVSSVFGLTALVTFTQKPVYESQAKLLFNKQSGASSLTGLSSQVGQLSGLTNLSNPVDTEAEVIRSNPIVQRTINSLNLKDKFGKPLTIEQFLKLLKLKTIRGTDVMQISYRSTNPQEAATVINSLMRYYLESNVRTNRSEARAAREFLSKQLPEIEQRVLKAEIALRRFKEQNRVVALDVEAKAGVEGLKDLEQEITTAQGELAAAKTRSTALQSQMDLNVQQAVELSTLSQSPGIQEVLKEYQKADDELAVARTRLTDDNPTIVNLEQKQAALRSQLERRVGQTLGSSEFVPEQNLQIGELKQNLSEDLVKSEVERLALENRVAQLRKAYIINKNRLDILPRLEQQQLQLQRQMQVAKVTYEQLVKQFQEVEMIENQNVGNARIISDALVPDKSVSPIIPLNLALGGFLGILLGVGAALILESTDNSLKTIEEVKQLLDYPLLGTIPLAEKPKNSDSDEAGAELPVLNNPYAPESVAFEMLQANIGFSISDKTLKVIVISSSIPGEGKSFVAANLAVAAAQIGRKVLLVDADMRRPRQHKIWEQSNLIGLSNILVNQAELPTTTKEALMTLDLVTAGTIPPNAAVLLESKRMAALIKEASNEYDFVIIDAPPLTAVADAQILGKLVDGILLVVRPGVVESAAAIATKNLLAQSGQRVLGMVVNGITSGSSYGGYYSKGYYHQNGHSKNGKVDVQMPNIRIS